MSAFFSGKKILIIGGTGTIGQGLLRNLLPEGPAVIRLFSRDEYKQFKLQQQYRNMENIRFLIGDVRDADRLERAMQDVDYVFHTAAMKHVPACEYNPFEAVQTNVMGTQNVIQAALHARVKKVVLTSTDKSIAPTNTYGASKLMAERLMASAQYYSGSNDTVFAAVRFGNVMGSRGSVIPLFTSQIERERRITITDRSMSRFMMTVSQAATLTMNAMEQAHGGEIFVLKMPVIRLQDLADAVIERVCGRLCIEPSDISIEEIGLRPGEKIYEELMTMEEANHALELSEMFVLPNPFLKRVPLYREAKPAEHRSYSSHGIASISREEVVELLQKERLV